MLSQFTNISLFSHYPFIFLLHVSPSLTVVTPNNIMNAKRSSSWIHFSRAETSNDHLSKTRSGIMHTNRPEPRILQLPCCPPVGHSGTAASCENCETYPRAPGRRAVCLLNSSCLRGLAKGICKLTRPVACGTFSRCR